MLEERAIGAEVGENADVNEDHSWEWKRLLMGMKDKVRRLEERVSKRNLEQWVESAQVSWFNRKL